MEEYVLYRDENLPVESFKKFQEIRQLKRFSDVNLKVDNAQFPVHRIVLAATIPYFHSMFMGDMAESRQKEVTIQGIEPKTLDNLLEFAYTGSIRITSSNVYSLISGSAYMQLFNVRNACCDFLKKRLKSNNVIGIRALANQLDCCDLEEAANQFIDENFVQTSQSEEFLSLEFKDVRDIISREKLRGNTPEEKVFNAMMIWVKRDQDNRKEMLPELLSKIGMHLMSPEVLVDQVGKEPLIRSSLECMDLLDKAKDYHLVHRHRDVKTKINSHNHDSGYIYAVGSRILEIYSCESNCWMEEENLPFHRLDMLQAIIALHQKLYFVIWARTAVVKVFAPKNKNWSTTAPTIYATRNSCLAVLLNKIYMCGCCTKRNGVSRTVQCYDPKVDKWEVVEQMMEYRSLSCAVALDDCLYVLGGRTLLQHEVGETASVEKYDPKFAKWSSSTAMLTKRSCFGASVMNGKFYVSGGRTTGNTVSRTAEEYNPITKQWKYIRSMNVARKSFGLVSACGRLYAIGGFTEDNVELNSVEVYNPEEDTWSFVASMKKMQGLVGAAEFYK